MPIYEFKCKNCGNIFEYLCLKSSDKDNASCPSCGRKETAVFHEPDHGSRALH